MSAAESWAEGPRSATRERRREGRARRDARLEVAGLVAAVVFVVLASVARALSNGPLSTADETAHLDYAYEVWHGHLPVFERGIQFHPAFGAVPPVQWVSQHPPLFYALLAPVVGPLIDGNHLYIAVIAGRFEDALIAGTTVLATWWAARQVRPGDRVVAVVAALATASTGMLILVGGAIYNDLVNVTFCALAIGLAARALRTGLTTRLVVAAALVGVGGMLSRLVFAVFLLGLVVALFVAPTRAVTARGAWGRRVLAAVVVGVVAALGAGWFYLRNRALTGNVAGSHPAWAAAHLGRHDRTASSVVTDKGFWEQLFAVYRAGLPTTSPLTWVLLLAPLVLAAVVGVVVLVRTLRARGRRHGSAAADAQPTEAAGVVGRPLWGVPAGWWIAAMMVAVVVLTVFLEVRFVMGGGAPNTRYALPLVPVTAIVGAIGLTALGRIAGTVLTVLWSICAVVAYSSAVGLVTPVGPAIALTATRGDYVVSLVVFAFMVVAAVVLRLRRPPAVGVDAGSESDVHADHGGRPDGA
ncbi:glycosyltransferase family 39 protein [Curtobacterium sp. MCBD17_003]|uniref:glycosyltransferase family 39 protein n=1 Tax=Curtobacterium sp. MCBD17_003 TaxID=2175667 RepID=UPI000DA88A08|nr:glycosyltransferase family 39 protein [Curtobacterium sp. MCBD17_003]WIE53565.1 glycosyltransferase family 39 protein [Curtobacterium sp. MCBD17_003]